MRALKTRPRRPQKGKNEMRTDAKTARKIGALYFDENTILEVKQLGGGGAGVGGANGLNARNLVTGEDTGEVIAAQAGQIEEQGEQIDALTAQNTELQAENTELQTENAELTGQLEEAEAALANAYIATPIGFEVINNTENTYHMGIGESYGNVGSATNPHAFTVGTLKPGQTRFSSRGFYRKHNQSYLKIWFEYPMASSVIVEVTTGADKCAATYRSGDPSILVQITDDSITNIGLKITLN